MSTETVPSFPPGFLEESIQPGIYAVSGIFIGLTTIAVILRFISRRLGKVGFRWDDVIVIVGYIVFLASTGTCMADTTYGGAGLHTAAVEMIGGPEMVMVLLKFQLVIPLFYLASVVLPKLALIAIYLNIFTHTQRPFRIACWTVAGVTVANWIAETVAAFTICIPLTYLWEQIEGAQGHCFDINSWFRWASFLNIVTDIILLIMPIPIVWKIQVPIPVRVGLIFTFMLGSIGLIASIIRFVGFFTTNAEADLTWAAGPLLIWTIVESGMYLIACCLPTYRPLLRKLGFNVNFSMQKKSSNNRYNGAGQDSDDVRGISNKESKFPRITEIEEDNIGLVDEVPLKNIRVEHEFIVQ